MADQAKPIKKPWRRRSMFALIVLLLVYWFCVHTSTLRVSPETTHVTGPLMPDGTSCFYSKPHVFKATCL